MLKKFITINNFGVFNNFNWDSTVRDKGKNVLNFKRLNILYARNYSGKTTLSRIVQCLEHNHKHPQYVHSLCEFQFDEPISNFSLDNLKNTGYQFRVYNKDFVTQNLNWSHDDKGDIKPFAVMGEENIEIAEILKVLKPLIEEDKENSGCFAYHLNASSSKLTQKIREKDAIVNERKASLAAQAKLMKESRHLYSVKASYTQNDLEQDIKKYEKLFYVPFNFEIKQKISTQAQEIVKNHITYKFQYPIALSLLANKIKNVISKTITPSTIIKKLEDDQAKYDWVLKGIKLHKEKNILDECTFCGNKLSPDFFKVLDNYFNDEVMAHEAEINSLISDIAIHLEFFRNQIRLLPKSTEFYKDLEVSFLTTYPLLINDFKEKADWLKNLEKILNVKKSKIHNSLEIIIPDLDHYIPSIYIIDDIIEKHNSRTEKFDTNIQDAKDKLTLDTIFGITLDTNYFENIKNENTLAQEAISLEIDKDKIYENYQFLIRYIDYLENNRTKQISGIKQINDFLTHYFSANHLYLDAFDNETSFKVMRDGVEAHHLSEGECSLVSFCYFMAKLKELDDLSNTIIWIDDPISSLDYNHIFYVFSLIENELTKHIKVEGTNVCRYKQLFISTHNLDFLKYLTRLTYPKIANSKTHDQEFFMIERLKNTSQIKQLPSYIKQYGTEYNYVFSKIYQLATTEDANLNDDIVYNFGNNLRKFFEAHLFFKYPTNKLTPEQKLEDLVKDYTDRTILNRLTNELSHLKEDIDRSMQVLDRLEMKKLAQAVLNILQANDTKQYDALIESC